MKKIGNRMPESHENQNEESFESLLGEYLSGSDDRCHVGEKIDGTILSLSEDVAFVDIGRRCEGILTLSEFRDPEGNLTIQPGDRLSLWVTSIKGDEILLSRGLQFNTSESKNLLREAYENNIPVQGTVKAINKGGFEIDLGGTLAFCPMSKIDRFYCENPESMIGLNTRFKIITCPADLSRVVVSRRDLLEAELKENTEILLRTLSFGDIVTGNVTRILRSGVFVDIQGVNGFIPLRELSRKQINNPEELIKLDQQVKVKVIDIPKEISSSSSIVLSLRALEPDPWDVELPFSESDIVHGKITRIEKFGVFVELTEDGIQGLLHVSNISDQRSFHPSKFFKPNDTITVKIQQIDIPARRISLEWQQSTNSDESSGSETIEPMDGIEKDGSAGRFGSLGNALRQKLDKLKQS